MIVVGIDEAGRGSLIGPMVIAGIAIEENKLQLIRGLGVKDSKQLSRRKREDLFQLLQLYAEGFIVVKVYPEEIDVDNLNELEYRAMKKIINVLSVFSPSKITVDKVGDAREVENEIFRIGSQPNVVYKADVNFVEASAASIIAKVVRDRIIEELKRSYGDFGSGYPSDPKTVNWVKKLYKCNSPPPSIIRRSWKILQEIAPNYYIRKW